MEYLEILRDISALAGCILSLITLGGIIVRPIRNKVISYIGRLSNTDIQNQAIASLETSNREQKESTDELKEMIKELAKKILKNEEDRLRGELFNCGSRCRRGVPLSLEEYRFIQGVYEKYSDELHANHLGTDEYEFIKRYFDSEKNQNSLSKGE